MIIFFDNTIADMETNKKISLIITELFTRGITILFQSGYRYKTKRDTFFILEISNKTEHQDIVSNYFSNTDIKDSMKLLKGYAKEPFLFLVRNTTSTSVNPLRFRTNLLVYNLLTG